MLSCRFCGKIHRMYTATIGLEIHAELKTRTKMFCGCPNNPDEKEPNTNVCAVCLAHPGSLPVINAEAVRKVLMVGTALGGTLADYSEFDRKNYFYPDIPKGYQISQYKYPLVAGGSLRSIAVTRVHLEEDTARSSHQGSHSLVDYNRAGVPLMELVTEPVLHTAKEAGDFARELQLLLRTLGASEANMEKGEMRVEANISVSKDNTLGTKVEVKNLNSFRSAERAIAYEIERQSKLLEAGAEVVQETRGWDEAKQATFSQRKKEKAHDYRYFPDPDLPKLTLSEVSTFADIPLPELPWTKRERLGVLLKSEDVEQLLADVELCTLFEETAALLQRPELQVLAANFVLNDIAGERKKHPAWALPTAQYLAKVVEKYHAGEFASPQAKTSILSGTMASAADTGAIPAIAKQIIEAHPSVVADYKAGKEAAMQYLVGQGMKASRGSANPQALREAIQELLG